MISDSKLAIILISTIALAVFCYGVVTESALDSGLVHTAIAAVSGLAGYELGKKA